MKIRAGLVLLCVCMTLAAASMGASAAQVEEQSAEALLAQQRYVDPLGLTMVIGQEWHSPEELDPDSVLTVFMIRAVENEALRARYYNRRDDMYYFPQGDVEGFAHWYFGMTPEQVRRSTSYSLSGGLYAVPPGLGGAWSVKVHGVVEKDGLLVVRYYQINAQDKITGDGGLGIQLTENGGYRYRYNWVDAVWPHR